MFCIRHVYRKVEQRSESPRIKPFKTSRSPLLIILTYFLTDVILFCTPGLNNEEYQVVIGNDTTSYIIDDLEPARNYSFYIVAYMPMGASRMSDQVSQHTLEDGKNRALRLPAFLAINHLGGSLKCVHVVCTEHVERNAVSTI